MADQQDPKLPDNVLEGAALNDRGTAMLVEDDEPTPQQKEDEKLQGERSGSNMERSGLSGVSFRDIERRAKNERAANSLLLYAQIREINAGIANLEYLIEEYGQEIEELEDLAGDLKDTANLTPDLLERIREYEGHAGLNRLYREYYGEMEVLAGADNNLWGSLEHNILRDEQGRMVYMDEYGELYTLATDENGTATPERLYYENEAIILKLYSEIYTGEPPKLVANKTPFGEDVNNNFKHEINAWGVDYQNLAPDAAKPEETIASIEMANHMTAIVCNAQEVCTRAAAELEWKIIEHRENLKTYGEELKALKEERDQLPKGGYTSEKLEELNQRIEALEGQIEEQRDQIADLQEQAIQSDQSLVDTFDLDMNMDHMQLDERLSNRVENGTINADHLQDMLDDLPPESREYILDEISKRGIHVINPDQRMSMSPHIFDGPGVYHDVADVGPNVPIIPGLNTMPINRQGSQIAGAFKNCADIETMPEEQLAVKDPAAEPTAEPETTPITAPVI